MGVPTAYTEEGFLELLLRFLSDIGVFLGWTVETPEIGEALTETLLSYGKSDIAEATDIRKVRALGRLEAWRAASEALASRYDHESEGEKDALSKLHAQALAQLKEAKLGAATYLDDTPTERTSIGSRSGAAQNRAVW